MNLHDSFESIPCTICSRPTRMTGTKLCDGCWHVNRGLADFVKHAAGRRIVAKAMFDAVEKRFNEERVLSDHNVEVVHQPGTGWIVSWDHGPAVLGFLRRTRPGTAEREAAAVYVDLFLRGVPKDMAIDLAVRYVEVE